MKKPLWQAFVVGTLFAVVFVLAVYVVARWIAGDPLTVQGPGQPEAAVIPIPVAIFATVLAGVLGLAAAALLRGARFPRPWFVIACVVGFVLFSVTPFVATSRVSTIVWLLVMHVAAFVGIVPPLARRLAPQRHSTS